jgi:hypothetical protein
LHTFIGGNVQMLEAIAGVAGDAGYKDRAAATRTFLAGSLSLAAASKVTDGKLVLSVTIRNLAGHKLPTGLPGRRIWLHLTARDAADRVLFESGAWDAATGNLKSASKFEPHRKMIERPDQTVVYEAVVEDDGGRLTNLLTRAARYRKDNRLLPDGFDPSRMTSGMDPGWIEPAGTREDPDFAPGGDSVHYQIPMPKSGGPLRVSVDACFQSIRPDEANAVPGLDRAPVIVRSLAVVVP